MAKVTITTAAADGASVVATFEELLALVADASEDIRVSVSAEVVDYLMYYLRTDVSCLWVTYGEESVFNIMSNVEWIIE